MAEPDTITRESQLQPMEPWPPAAHEYLRYLETGPCPLRARIIRGAPVARTNVVTSWVIPIDGPPISSHARATPIRKQTTTRIAIVLTARESPGLAITSIPSISWITNATASPIQLAGLGGVA